MLDRDRYHEWNERAQGADVTNFLDIEKDVRPLADKLLSYGAKVILIKCGTPGIYFRTAEKNSLLKSVVESEKKSQIHGPIRKHLKKVIWLKKIKSLPEQEQEIQRLPLS